MNILDMTLQRSFPTVMVPRNETVAEMLTAGERLLIAENGVFLEVRRPWLSLVRQVAEFNVRTAIPYGRVTPSTRLLCETIPADLVGAFAEMARKEHPLETGAWIVWSPSTQAFRLAPVGIVTHTAGSLKYQPPTLAGDEVLVMDCHSHGRHRHLLLAEGGGQRRFIGDRHEPVAEERRWHVFHQRHRTRQIGHRVASDAMSPVVGRVDVALIDRATRDHQRAGDGKASFDNGCVTHGVSPGSWPSRSNTASRCAGLVVSNS